MTIPGYRPPRYVYQHCVCCGGGGPADGFPGQMAYCDLCNYDQCLDWNGDSIHTHQCDDSCGVKMVGEQ